MEKEVARVTQSSEVNIRTTMEPGDVGYVIYLHGALYAREYGLDRAFEGGVAQRFGEYAKQYDPRKDFFAVAELEGRIVGSIVIHGLADNTAQLRFFLLHPDVRGRGIGRELMNQAVTFCREHGFSKVGLWTISELKAAGRLYREFGFVCTREKTHQIWGATRTEQEYELTLKSENQ